MREAAPLTVIAICLLSALPALAADKPSPQKVQPMKDLSSVMPAHGTASVKPADRWEYAFVSGNGTMGAMAFGAAHDETIVANHARLFLPLGSREILPDMAKYLPELRRIIRETGYGNRSQSNGGSPMDFFLGEAKKQGFPGLQWTDPYHPGFFLNIKSESNGPVTDYVRTEDFATGEVVVRWTDDAGTWVRRMFVSRPDNVIVLQITPPENKKLSCDITMPPIEEKRIQSAITIDAVTTCHNVYVNGKGGYDGVVRVLSYGRGSEQIITGAKLRVSGARKTVLLMRIEPFTKVADSDLGKLRDAIFAIPADYDKLFARHAKVHREMFGRVSLDLGAPAADRALPGEALLERAAKTGKCPLALAEKMHDGGRYMFLCAAGELPPNLQGIWTGTWRPSWSGDFTLDTNVQAAIGSGLSGRMPEGMEGYYRFIESMIPEMRQNAKMYYGCRGVFSGTRASNTGLHLHWGKWPGVFWTAGAGWLAHWFYDHYRYTGDKEFLARRTVPLLKEIALFYEDFLAGSDGGKDGTYHFVPSYSPETGCGIDATMDIAVAREVLTCLIEGCRELGIEADNIPKWQGMIDKLPAYRINAKGELAEWITSDNPEKYGHRHCSHLYPVFQSFELTCEKHPKLWAAAKKATQAKIDAGGERSSFNRIQSGIAAAYLRMPAAAWKQFTVMATMGNMYPSMITSHEPRGGILNTDGNGSLPELLNMMLFFSWPGRLDLLPALPDELPTGTIKGVAARKRIRIDELTWDAPAGKVKLTLTSEIEQTITLRLPNAEAIKEIDAVGGEVSQGTAANARKLKLPAHSAVTVDVAF